MAQALNMRPVSPMPSNVFPERFFLPVLSRAVWSKTFSWEIHLKLSCSVFVCLLCKLSLPLPFFKVLLKHKLHIGRTLIWIVHGSVPRTRSQWVQAANKANSRVGTLGRRGWEPHVLPHTETWSQIISGNPHILWSKTKTLGLRDMNVIVYTTTGLKWALDKSERMNEQMNE